MLQFKGMFGGRLKGTNILQRQNVSSAGVLRKHKQLSLYEHKTYAIMHLHVMWHCKPPLYKARSHKITSFGCQLSHFGVFAVYCDHKKIVYCIYDDGIRNLSKYYCYIYSLLQHGGSSI